MKIVIIAGSNRKEATSTILAKALQAQMNLGSVETELFNLYETPLPFYSPDEIFNRHEGVRELQRLLMEADGIILTTPEYHGGMSGVLKNALDHMGQMHFSGKPVLSVSSAGGAVGVSSLQQMQATVRNLHGINSPEWISIGGLSAIFTNRKRQKERSSWIIEPRKPSLSSWSWSRRSAAKRRSKPYDYPFRLFEIKDGFDPGVKQFYHDLLHFPVTRESGNEIEFQPTPDFTLKFEEAGEPITPVHMAFEVAYSQFEFIVQKLGEQMPLLKGPDGKIVASIDSSVNVYFRDGDGNLLEFLAHPYLKEDVLVPYGTYGVLYLREVGLPVEDPVAARLWMKQTLGLTIAKESDQFAFVIGGTAHAVVVSTMRKWIPIAMYALAPSLEITYGVTDERFLDRVRSSLDRRMIISDTEEGLHFRMYGYSIRLKVTSFPKDIAVRLNLPHAAEGEEVNSVIGDEFLEEGLTALSRGGEVGWFEGHVGGAYLAAYYMQKSMTFRRRYCRGWLPIAATCAVGMKIGLSPILPKLRSQS